MRPPEPTKTRLALLALALVVVGVVVIHPHWNIKTGEQYWFPVHMDDYVHWGSAKAVVDQETVSYGNPFSGGRSVDIDHRAGFHERGYHAFFAVLSQVTNLDLLQVWTWTPTITAVFLALAAFALVERWGGGVEAALLTAAIPSTLRFLGPAYMVPIAFVLPIVVVGILISVHARGGPAALALAIVASAAWMVHTMGGLTVLALGVLMSVFSLSPSWLIAVASPALLAIPYIREKADVATTPFLSGDPSVFRMFGLIPVILAAIGSVVLAAAEDGRRRRAGLVMASMCLLCFYVLIRRLVTNEDFGALYDRTHMILFLLSVLLGGAALGAIRGFLSKAVGSSRIRGITFVAAAVVVIIPASAVATSAGLQLDQPYYRVLSEREHQSYLLLAPKLADIQGFAVVDGLSGMPFSITTGIPLTWTATPGKPQLPDNIAEFFDHSASDTYFLVASGSEIVVTDRTVSNPDLDRIAQGVYTLNKTELLSGLRS